MTKRKPKPAQRPGDKYHPIYISRATRAYLDHICEQDLRRPSQTVEFLAIKELTSRGVDPKDLVGPCRR